MFTSRWTRAFLFPVLLLVMLPDAHGGGLEIAKEISASNRCDAPPVLLENVRTNERVRSRIRNAKGIDLFNKRQFALAATAFEQALHENPADAEIWNNAGWAMFRDGRFEEASLSLHVSVYLAPSRSIAWINLGELQARRGQQHEAETSLEHAYRFSSTPSSVLVRYRRMIVQTNHPQLRTALVATLERIKDGPAHHGESDDSGEAPYSHRGLLHLSALARGGDKTSLKVLQGLAQAGAGYAAQLLAENYLQGRGVESNAKLALHWYMNAAIQGLPIAQYEAGLFYDIGRGIPRDADKAASWYRKSALSGDTAAMTNLAALYFEGGLGAIDYPAAVMLYQKASACGSAKAAYNLGLAYAQGHGVNKSRREASRYFLLSAQRDYIPAQLVVAEDYLYGRGVERDEAAARRWYQRASESGSRDARQALDSLDCRRCLTPPEAPRR